MKRVPCPYCSGAATFRPSSAHLYRGTDYGPVWECAPCQAWVGVHRGTETPLGRLANKELRRAKSAAHAAFDPLWKKGPMERASAYKWLAGQLEIERADCHIGMFDVAMCQRVIEICRVAKPGKGDRRIVRDCGSFVIVERGTRVWTIGKQCPWFDHAISEI